jgi:exodeoxyribonuclease III
MRIVTWNVNSLRARLERVTAWLARNEPDVVCLQELKCVDESFPAAALEALGYRIACHGQKTYNGVAILAKRDLADVARGFEGDPDPTKSRALAATVDGVRVLNLYVPNGQDVGTEKYAYKLLWLERLRAHLGAAYRNDEPLVVCGDFNVAPDDRDVYDAEKLRGTILCSDAERERFRALLAFGLADAFRMFNADAGVFTYWDYRAMMFRRGLGYRIDHLLLTPSLARRCTGVTVDREERKGEGASDHAPVVATFSDP